MPKKANKKIVPKAAAKKTVSKKAVKTVAKAKVAKKPLSKPIKKTTVSATKKSVAAKVKTKSVSSKKPVIKKVTKKPEKTTKKNNVNSNVATKKMSIVKSTATKTKKPAAKSTKAVVKPVKSVKPKITVTSTKKSMKTPPKKVIKTMSKAKPQTKKPSPATKSTEKKSIAANIDIMPYSISSKEEYMNEEQRKHIEQILLTLKAALQEEVDRTITHMQEEPANVPDVSDRASLEENFGVELRTRDRERLLLKKIDDALERVRRDDFGYCDTCGIEIGLRRLEARPTATMCIDCKEIAEVKEKQESGF